jgi:hypothetical protein
MVREHSSGDSGSKAARRCEIPFIAEYLKRREYKGGDFYHSKMPNVDA